MRRTTVNKGSSPTRLIPLKADGCTHFGRHSNATGSVANKSVKGWWDVALIHESCHGEAGGIYSVIGVLQHRRNTTILSLMADEKLKNINR